MCKKAIFLIVIAFLFISHLFSGTVEHWRDNQKIGTYSSIQNTLNLAIEGDEVRIDGNFYEKITWPNTPDIELIGSSYATAILWGTGLPSGPSLITFPYNSIDNGTKVINISLKFGVADNGGGISCSNSASPILQGLNIENCKANLNGGGIYFFIQKA